MPQDGDRRGPRHLAFHALTVLAVLVCLVAARWQWERAHRSEAEAVPDTPVVALADLDPTTAYAGMRVGLVGTFDAAGEVLVAPRAREGQAGAWVLTPLQPSSPAGAAAVAVVRGWVPDGAPPAEPPAGPVSVVAVLVADSRQPGAGVAGDPPTMPVVDTGALAAHAGYPVRSGWFALQAPIPAATDQPQPLQVTELPGADVGLNWRNASYALQWIAFAGFVLFFWVRFRRDLVRSEQESSR
jgi:cytochrome oxidase assembly protein ShyY1